MSSVSIPKSEVPASKPPARPKRRLRIRLTLVIFLGAVAVCLLTPSIFQFGIRRAAITVAHQHGIDLDIGEVRGSIFEPVSFYRAKLTGLSPGHASYEIEIERADADISMASLLFKRGAGCLRSVTIDGLTGKVKLPPGTSDADAAATGQDEAGTSWVEKMVPSTLNATRINLLFQRGNEFVQLQNLRGLVSDREPGTLQIDKVIINQSWLVKTFTSVKADTAFQNSKTSIANLSLEKNLTITSASSDLTEMANGRLKIDFELAAFNGSIRGEVRSSSASLDSPLEANGEFKQIAIPQLAEFLKFPGESSGVVNEGKFTFQGSWRDLQKSTLSVRFEATDFQLGKRKWNSLVAGATLVDNRLKINELSLKQAHNELVLKGSMALPQPGTEWWQSEFAFDISAKINNLTELSALGGPDFADMAGKVNVDGSINGSNQSFTGELTVSGSNLAYRTAPLDTLHASLKLNGNELQIANLELSSKNDYVRGQGVVNILGEQKRYWGQLKASVDDLTRYSAILQKPIIPQPLAGGLVVDWSGDGVQKAHSGAFHAQLKKFRLISVKEPKAHPLNADVEATYSPGNIFFSKFLVWDNNTNLTAKVTASPKSLNLQSIRLQQGSEVWLEGDALLPFNVWSAWANASWATLLEYDSPCKLNLTAKNLDLHETALLSGRELPVKGQLDINLTTDGTLNDIKTNGKVQLKKWQVTLGENEPNVIGGDASLVFADKNLEIEKTLVHYNSRDFGVQGDIDLKNLHDPGFDVAISTKKSPLPLRGDIAATADLDLDLLGTYGETYVSGAAHLQEIKLPEKPDPVALIYSKGSLNLSPALPFDASQPPFNTWQYDVTVDTPQPVKTMWLQDNTLTPESAPKYETNGTLAVTGALRGNGPAIRFSGDAVFQNVVTSSEHSQMTVNEGTLLYAGDNSPVWISLAVSGKAASENFTGWIFGSQNAKEFYFFSNPPVSQEVILDLITAGVSMQPRPIANPDAGGDVPLDLTNFAPAPEPSTSLDVK